MRAEPGPAVPVRMCVGCRRREAARDLLRVVAVRTDPDSIMIRPDPYRIEPGRGAHLHPTPACLASAVRRRAFGRALRATGVVDVEALTEAVHGTDPTIGTGPRIDAGIAGASSSVESTGSARGSAR